MYIIHAPSVGVNCTWWVIFSATVTEILQGIRKAASVSQVFKPARTAREKVGNWKSSLKLGYLTRKMIKQWDFGVSNFQTFLTFLTYWHISWHILWHISWYVFWHYSDILFELLWQFDMYSAAWRLAFILTLALTWSAVTWRLDDHMMTRRPSEGRRSTWHTGNIREPSQSRDARDWWGKIRLSFCGSRDHLKETCSKW